VAIRPAGPYHESYFQQIFANEDPANVKGLLEHLLAGEDTSREWLATCLEVADPVLIELLRERPAEE
jgi:hypothetical protein